MNWTAEYADLLRRYATKFQVPHVEGDEEGDSDTFQQVCRAWTRQLAEQFRYAFGPGWGIKRADSHRPFSKDCLPFKDGTVFVGWDVLQGTSSGWPVLALDHPQQWDLTGQYFEPVMPINWLGDPPPPAPPPPVPPSSDVEARLTRIESFMAQMFKGW